MSFFSHRLACLVSACLLCTASLSAQSSIHLDVVVTAKAGPPVANLAQSDFTLLDNKTPQHLTSFQALGGTQEPIHVYLVIDAVNAPYESIAYQRGEIDKFLRADGGRLPEPTALAFFTDKGIQVQEGFSTDGAQLSAALDQYAIGLRDIRRSSQFEANDRFQLSMNALRSLGETTASVPGRKLIFWVSPGWPLLSGPRIELDGKQQSQIFGTVTGLSTTLRENRVTLYDVNPIGAGEGVGRTFYYQDFVKGVTKPGQAQVADLSLQVLATQTGGLVLTGSNDLAASLKQCMADTEAYYAVSFTAAPADHRDEYHSIEVKVAKPGLTARTRTGYYAQP
jgi:VWFA-related protein